LHKNSLRLEPPNEEKKTKEERSREKKTEKKKEKKKASPVTVSGANSSLLRFMMIKFPLGLTFHLYALDLESKNEF
jgi:hypothetical protein